MSVLRGVLCTANVARKVALVTIASVLTLSLVVSDSFASPFGGPYQNSNAMFVFYYRLSKEYSVPTRWVRNNVIDPTDMNSYRYQSHCASDVSVMDSRFQHRTNTYGFVRCAVSAPQNICDHFHLRYNKALLHPGGRRVLACHEFGHTLGFDDYSGDGSTCTDESNDATKPSHFDNHDRLHINNLYPP